MAEGQEEQVAVDGTDIVSILRNRGDNARNQGVVCLLLILIISLFVTGWFLFLAQGSIHWAESHYAEIVKYNAETPAIIHVIGPAILAIGAAALSLYIIRILSNLVRSRFCIYDALNARADLLMVYRGEFNNLADLFKLLSLDEVGFDVTPQTSSETLLDALKTVAEKLPSKSSSS